MDYLLIGLEWSTDAINRRINARVKAMFDPPVGPDGRRAESLPDEVRRLEAAGLLGPPGGQARQALGYKQVLDHLAGRTTIEQALEQTKIATRRFAKSQRTWLRRFRDVHWLVADESGTDALANAAEKIVSQ